MSMIDSTTLRFLAIIVGTILWNVGAVLQKKAVDRLPSGRPRASALIGSAPWMAGLVVTGLGWGAYVFGLDRVPLSTARTITGGSYVVLALFSLIFLRTPLRLTEWIAVAVVTAGVIMLGVSEPASVAVMASITSALSAARIALGIAFVTACCLLAFFIGQLLEKRSRFLNWRLVVFAALSGLLSSIGDLCVKVLLVAGHGSLSMLSTLVVIAAAAAGLVAFYLPGFYMLSRAYQAGSMVSSVVISDFFARVGAIFLGAVALSDLLLSPVGFGAPRIVGLALVLGGSLLLGRFSGSETPAP
jgi:uncharacterized membrane protein